MPGRRPRSGRGDGGGRLKPGLLKRQHGQCNRVTSSSCYYEYSPVSVGNGDAICGDCNSEDGNSGAAGAT